MRIRTRFRVITLASLGTVLSLVAILGWTLRARTQAEAADTLAENLNRELSERAMIRQEYFIHGEARAKALWERKTQRIAGMLDQAEQVFTAQEEREDLADVRMAFNHSQAFFRVMVDTWEPLAGAVDAGAVLRERMADQAILATYQLFDGSRRLSELTSRRLESTHRRTMLVVYLLVGSVLLLTVLTLGLASRLLETRLARLRDGTARVAAGDLAFRLGMRGEDELADLGRAFDAMTARLQAATGLLEQEVAERRQAEQRVDQLNRELDGRVQELEVSNRELESFSYSVSHDLRAPLRHISGFLDLLEERNGGQLDGESHRYMRIVQEAARKMATLIDDLLSYSRLARVELVMGPVDLNSLVQEVMTMTGEHLVDRDLVWEVASLPRVHGDATLLRVIWQNLISNAVKFTRGRAPARIQIGAEVTTPGEIRCFVKDNGVGFDMQYEAKLFTVFQRLHSADQFEGTGIGLANVRRMVERQGGRVWAQSVLGEGSTFWFALPLHEEEA